LPRIAAAVPQEGVLRRLLADGRSPADPPAAGVALHRVLDGVDVEAVVLAELAVLGGNRGTHHVAVDLGDWHPVARRSASGDEVTDHIDGRRRIDEAIGEDPQDREQEKSDDQLYDPAEEPTGDGASRASSLVPWNGGFPPSHRKPLAA